MKFVFATIAAAVVINEEVMLVCPFNPFYCFLVAYVCFIFVLDVIFMVWGFAFSSES